MTSLLLWKSILIDNAIPKDKKKIQTKHKMKSENHIECINMCRICDKEEGEIPILDNSVFPNIAKDIFNFSGVKVEFSDALSNYMCQSCLDLLNGCIMFREMCRKTNEMIVEMSIMKETYGGCSDNITACDDFGEETKYDDSCNIPSPNFSEGIEANWTFNKKYLTDIEINALNTPRRKKRQRRRKDKSQSSNLCLCDVCGKSVTPKGLLSHKSIHENIFPYKCSKCPYKGRTPDLLNTHQRTHLPKDKLPYKCTMCPTAMTSASNLAKHMRGHARAKLTNKSYKCTYCETAFVYKYDMTRHIKQKHMNTKQNTIQCEVCFIQFNSSFDLPQKCLSDVKINSDHYNVSETYHIGTNAIPTDAHYDTYGNLFYVESMRSEDGYHFNIYVMKSKTTTPQNVPGLPEGISYSIAVDVKKTKVYFGTGKGMYTYNYESFTAVPITNSSIKTDMIFIDKNSNKYIIENINGIEEFYLLDGDSKIRCQNLEALNEMAIDNKNNFYFIRADKLYVMKSTNDTPTCIGNVNYGGNAQISFHKDNVFIASDKLSYFHENETGSLKSVDNIPGNVTAIAFDHDGEFILGIQGKLLKYKKSECYLRDNRVIDEYSTAL